MRTLILVGAAALSLSAIAPALAADMPLKAAPVAAPVAPWQGFFFGGSLGGDWEDPGLWTFGDGRTVQLPSASSWVAGLHTGFNWQFGHLVLGTETNYRFTDLSSSSACPGTAGQNRLGGLICQQKIQNIFTFGGRAGFAYSDWLLYGTGGYASTGMETNTFNATTGLLNDGAGHWHNGWFGGAGLEYALTPDIVLGVQYTHINVNNHTETVAPVNLVEDRNISAKIDMVEARVSFKLWSGMWGPFSK